MVTTPRTGKNASRVVPIPKPLVACREGKDRPFVLFLSKGSIPFSYGRERLIVIRKTEQTRKPLSGKTASFKLLQEKAFALAKTMPSDVR